MPLELYVNAAAFSYLPYRTAKMYRAPSSPIKSPIMSPGRKEKVHQPYDIVPVARAPENVFILRDPKGGEQLGWRNTYSLEISYDVKMVQGIFDLKNDVLATKHLPAEVSKRRFIVIGKKGWMA